MKKENTFKQALKLVVAQELITLGVGFAIFTADKVIKHYKEAKQAELDRISDVEDQVDDLYDGLTKVKNIVHDVISSDLEKIEKKYNQDQDTTSEPVETKEPVEEPVEDKKPSKKKSVTKKSVNRRKKAKEESEAKQVEETPAPVTEEDVQG